MATFRYLVDDVDAATGFYRDILGFDERQSWGGVFAMLVRDDVELWLSGPETSARRPLEDGSRPVPGGWNRMVIRVDNIEEWAQGLREVGALRNPPITGPGGAQALAQDPSGNVVELFEAR